MSRGRRGRWQVMLGYSDSNKTARCVTANWAHYRDEIKLAKRPRLRRQAAVFHAWRQRWPRAGPVRGDIGSPAKRNGAIRHRTVRHRGKYSASEWPRNLRRGRRAMEAAAPAGKLRRRRILRGDGRAAPWRTGVRSLVAHAGIPAVLRRRDDSENRRAQIGSARRRATVAEK